MRARNPSKRGELAVQFDEWCRAVTRGLPHVDCGRSAQSTYASLRAGHRFYRRPEIAEHDVGDNLGQCSAVQAVIDKFGPSDMSKLAADFDAQSLVNESSDGNHRALPEGQSRVNTA